MNITLQSLLGIFMLTWAMPLYAPPKVNEDLTVLSTLTVPGPYLEVHLNTVQRKGSNSTYKTLTFSNKSKNDEDKVEGVIDGYWTKYTSYQQLTALSKIPYPLTPLKVRKILPNQETYSVAMLKVSKGHQYLHHQYMLRLYLKSSHKKQDVEWTQIDELFECDEPSEEDIKSVRDGQGLSHNHNGKCDRFYLRSILEIKDDDSVKKIQIWQYPHEKKTEICFPRKFKEGDIELFHEDPQILIMRSRFFFWPLDPNNLSGELKDATMAQLRDKITRELRERNMPDHVLCEHILHMLEK